MTNYEKVMLLQKKNLPEEIFTLIKHKFKLELIHDKAEKNKQILANDLKHILRSNEYKYTIQNFYINSNDNRYTIEYHIPINHWIINYKKNDRIKWNECSRQMVHCIKCGEYRDVSDIEQQYMLNDFIKCSCNPFPISFFNSKYFIPEMWYSPEYLTRFQNQYF